MKTPPELDVIADKVLAYNPDAPKGPLKVIAGAPDRPLIIGEIEIPAYVLEDETRVLTQAGFLSSLGRSPTPPAGASAGTSFDKLPFFLRPERLKPFISKELTASTNPIKFRMSTGGHAVGYNAILLPQVCEVYLKAREAGALLASQQHIAARAEILIRGLATVGIIALVDEATGYQRIREERLLATILERFIAKELQPWTRTFPFEFYTEICRLKGWPGANAIRRPSVIGRYTNDVVYERIAPELLKELQERNPVLPESGRRQHKHHQWFNRDYGHPKLLQHLAAVIALMRNVSTWDAFKRSLDRVFPKVNKTIPLALDEPEQ